MADWILGTDRGGTVYLFQQGARDTRTGRPAGTAGLVNWFNLGPQTPGGQGSQDIFRKFFHEGVAQSPGTVKSFTDALGKLRLTSTQTATIIQSIDAGTIMQGGKYVAVPRNQRPGQTRTPQGQKKSASEAVQTGLPSPTNFITSPLDFLKFIAWLFHPINLLRMVEFLTGMALILYGINTLIKGTLRSGRTHSHNLVRSVAKVFVPESRIVARAGRKAGKRQGQRDVAYREARRNVLRGSSNPPIEKRVRDAAE